MIETPTKEMANVIAMLFEHPDVFEHLSELKPEFSEYLEGDWEVEVSFRENVGSAENEVIISN